MKYAFVHGNIVDVTNDCAILSERAVLVDGEKSVGFVPEPEDLTTLRTVKMVMGRGRLIRKPKVRRNPVIDQELDKFL